MTSIGRDSRFTRLAVLFSQSLNVLIFNGEPDETISGRAYRDGILGGDETWARRARVIDRAFALIIGQSEHCRASHEKDRAFARAILYPAVQPATDAEFT